MSTRVAGCAPLVSATAQRRQTNATTTATPAEPTARISSLTGRELRAQLKAQHSRNSPAQADSCGSPAVAPEPRHYRWRVILADGTPFEVCCLPETTAAEMRALYMGARVEPLPDEQSKRPATTTERAELVDLTATIYAKDTPAGHAEALAHALVDPGGALICYRAIALQMRHGKDTRARPRTVAASQPDAGRK